MVRIFFAFLLFLLPLLGSAQSHKKDSLEILLKSANNDTTRCNLLVVLAEFLYELNPDTVIPLSIKTISIVDNAILKANPKEKHALLIAKASALNNIGIIKGEQGKINESISYCKKSLQAHIDNNNKMGMASAYHNLGYTYDNTGDIPMALEYYHKALKIQEELNDKAEIAMSLNDIGYLYKNQGDITKALEYYDKSLKYRQETKDQHGESMSLNNIGNIYDKNGIPDCKSSYEICIKEGKRRALQFYKKSMEIQDHIHDLRGLAYSLNNIAIIYKEIGDDSFVGNEKEKLQHGEKLALEYFDKSLKMHQQIKNTIGIAYVTNNIANLYLTQGKTNEALKIAKKSMMIASELGQPEIIYRNAGTLKNIFKKLNRINEAYTMLELEIVMRDSLKSQNNHKASIQKEFQYVYEKKVAEDSVKTFEEKRVINAQLKQEKTQRFALYGGILLVGLFGIFMFNRFKVTKKQNHLIQIQKAAIQKQKELVEEHQKETLDSIHYAKRIQNALIANSDFITKNIPGNFIFFKPKDIVSGDFYWAAEHKHKFYLAVCDSTGHGVPGAFMSLLNMGFLSEAIKEKNIEEPGGIFNYVRERLTETISHDGQKDGMDGILFCFDKIKNTACYAAANNEPILIRDNSITELAKDKMPVGVGEKQDSFLTHYINMQKGDVLYLYTDGYADQFGGPKGKKFKYKQLNELLLSINTKAPKEQAEILESTFTGWQGSQEQVDDVLVIGVKI